MKKSAYQFWKSLRDAAHRIRNPMSGGGHMGAMLDGIANGIVSPVTIPISLVPETLALIFRPFFNREARLIIPIMNSEGVIQSFVTVEEEGRTTFPKLTTTSDKYNPYLPVSPSLKFRHVVEAWDDKSNRLVNYFMLVKGRMPKIEGAGVAYTEQFLDMVPYEVQWRLFSNSPKNPVFNQSGIEYSSGCFAIAPENWRWSRYGEDNHEWSLPLAKADVTLVIRMIKGNHGTVFNWYIRDAKGQETATGCETTFNKTMNAILNAHFRWETK